MGAYISNALPNLCERISATTSRGPRADAKNHSKPTIKLLLIGLDNAGKTTTVMHLLGRPIDDVVPTVGFSNLDMKQFNKFRVQIYDLGGGAKIRSIWKNYFALVHGIIYVIDSADETRVAEVKENLSGVVSDDKVAKKPILILINKQDIDGALDDVEYQKHLDLESLVNKHKCPTNIESCSASANYDPTKRQRDPGIDRGYSWLVRHIMNRWQELEERVERESNEQIEIEKQIMAERFKRFRGKAEAEESVPGPEVAPINGNPFKPINEITSANGKLPKNSVTVRDPRGASDSRSPSPQKSRHSPSKSPKTHKNVHEAQTPQANGLRTRRDRDERRRHDTHGGDPSSGSSPEKSARSGRHRETKNAELDRSATKTKKKRRTIFSTNKVTPLPN